MFLIGGVQIQRAHYYAIIAKRGFTIPYGVLIEEGALTEGLRYFGPERKVICQKGQMLCCWYQKKNFTEQLPGYSKMINNKEYWQKYHQIRTINLKIMLCL